MNIETQGDTLRITGLQEPESSNSNDFRDQIRAAPTEFQKSIKVDLAQTTFGDSCGLGALSARHKTAGGRPDLVCLVNPLPAVQQFLELTRLRLIFEISKSMSHDC